MRISDWLVPLSSVMVALLALLGVIYTAYHRKEPSTAEVWTENSNLRDRLDKQDDKIDEQDNKIGNLKRELEEQKDSAARYRETAERTVTILGTAFDILFRVTGSTHELTPADRAAVEQARALRTGSGSITLP